MLLNGFPIYKQLDSLDCGPTTVQMVAKHYGKSVSRQHLREQAHINRQGVSLLGISDTAESIGLATMGVKLSFEQLINEAPLPCILHWGQEHFVVIHKIKKRKGFFPFSKKNDDITLYIADPAFGLVKYNKQEFLQKWISSRTNGTDKGVCLLIKPTSNFHNEEGEVSDKTNFSFLLNYLKPYRVLILQLTLGLVIGSLLQLIFPFLTQSLVDVGIKNQNISFITLILIAQLFLFVGQTSVELIRGWILLHITTRINVSLISDFLIKLMDLPLRFFDSKLIGDIMERFRDHTRIESFLTRSSLQVLFSIVNFIVFGSVLAYYNVTIFIIFLIGSFLYLFWISLFLRRRKELDTRQFEQRAKNESHLYQLINGMPEIKLNNCEKRKRWEWEKIQAKLFKINIKSLSLRQYQDVGGIFFNQTKNILIMFIAAKSVVAGDITLGMMVAIQYIVGQLNAPLQNIISFVTVAQDAKISLERIGEVHNKDSEENPNRKKLYSLPQKKTINVKNLTFGYNGQRGAKVINDLNLSIPEKKITAIVGASGSGKTTLIKLLLGFYPPHKGKISVHNTSLENISNKYWRSKCGVVLQNGFIFSDSIANNISISDENIDKERLLHAVKVANIQDFIESLPLGYNTKIGEEGIGLSQGQKQRILIARAVYKSPEYLFLDEATNALDANNERKITENLNEFFKGKTVVIVAHRLSTVKNADQIVVLEHGKIIERGDHASLTEKRGAYYQLVKNQLELGN